MGIFLGGEHQIWLRSPLLPPVTLQTIRRKKQHWKEPPLGAVKSEHGAEKYKADVLNRDLKRKFQPNLRCYFLISVKYTLRFRVKEEKAAGIPGGAALITKTDNPAVMSTTPDISALLLYMRNCLHSLSEWSLPHYNYIMEQKKTANHSNHREAGLPPAQGQVNKISRVRIH